MSSSEHLSGIYKKKCSVSNLAHGSFNEYLWKQFIKKKIRPKNLLITERIKMKSNWSCTQEDI